MGKFDGFLICSDIDGTFVGEMNLAANIEAVRYSSTAEENSPLPLVGRSIICAAKTSFQ